MKRAILFLLLSLFAHQAIAQSRDVKHAWLDTIAGQGYRHADFGIVSARIALGRDTALAYRQLDTLIERHYGDMFWAIGTAATYYATQDVLRPDYKLKIRNAWKRFTPYRGDTENHFLMYYAAWLLMTQAYPNDGGDTWFNGKSSRVNYDEAKDYLVQWVNEIARYGQTEWDSPRYAYYFITPLVLLSEYVQDPKLKQLFTNALDLELTDYALEYLDGSYCGAHSRVGDAQALDARHNEAAAYGEYFFGDSTKSGLEDVAFAALTHFECPKVIRALARDRTNAYELYQYKRGRTAIRHAAVANAPVHKYTYMTDAYCLGSMQGGLVQPIQQQSWSLVINSDSTPNVITGLHPFFDSSELAMFFPEYPQLMMERIGQSKRGYPSEDKWFGGSPYERIYQDKNVLAALYDLPDSVLFDHVDLFLPAALAGMFGEIDSEAVRSPDWIIMHDGQTRVGIYLLSSYRLTRLVNGIRVRMRDPKAAYVMICEEIAHRSTSEFVNYLSALHIERTEDGLVSKGDNGKTIRISQRTPYDPLLAAKGRSLYRSPYVNSKLGSGVITLTHGTDKLMLDFTRRPGRP